MSAQKDNQSGFSCAPFANDRHKDEVECVHYIMDPTGTRVGCHFDQLGEPQRTDNYFFLVNGTSNETAIPFLDFVPFEARKMGKRLPGRVFSPTSHPGELASLIWARTTAVWDATLGSGPA